MESNQQARMHYANVIRSIDFLDGIRERVTFHGYARSQSEASDLNTIIGDIIPLLGPRNLNANSLVVKSTLVEGSHPLDISYPNPNGTYSVDVLLIGAVEFNPISAKNVPELRIRGDLTQAFELEYHGTKSTHPGTYTIRVNKECNE